jgi:hypothetical protein
MAVERNRPTIMPSVNALSESGRCHYWIRAGRITWCSDTTAPRRRRRPHRTSSPRTT